MRGIDSGDVDAMWEMVNDPVGAELTATSASFTRDQISAWCASRPNQDLRLDLAIIEKRTGLFAGEAVVNEYSPAEETANFRISLRGPEWYGRGLGTEATRLMAQYAFGNLGLSSLRLDVLERNHRARRVYEKCGFVATRSYTDESESWVAMELRPAAT